MYEILNQKSKCRKKSDVQEIREVEVQSCNHFCKEI